MPPLNDILLIGSFLLSVLAGVVALSKRRSEIDVNQATEAEKISAAWERLNKPNNDRIDALEQELKDTKAALKKALDRIQELEEENAALRRGQKPGRGFATA